LNSASRGRKNRFRSQAADISFSKMLVAVILRSLPSFSYRKVVSYQEPVSFTEKVSPKEEARTAPRGSLDIRGWQNGQEGLAGARSGEPPGPRFPGASWYQLR
jgi:hypothetical protein